MASIPVLNDRQMNALRRLTGTSRKFNLVPTAKAKTRNLPSYEEEVNTEVVYNGYFTIKTRMEGEAQKIVVCDGKSYNPATGQSGVSRCKVNEYNYSIQSTTISPENGSKMIILVYTPDNGGGRGDVSIEIVDDIDDEERPIYLIGEYTFADGTLEVIQRHGTSATSFLANGMAYIEYFETCYELT